MEKFEQLAWFKPSDNPDTGLYYKPVFLGYDYFNKVNIVPMFSIF